MFYAHYDGQPVDPAQWATPPWTPVLRDKALDGRRTRDRAAQRQRAPSDGEWRLYGRSASRRQGADRRDAGGARCACARGHAAVGEPQGVLRRRRGGGIAAPVGTCCAATATCSAPTLWLFGDGPVHQSRRQQVVFGARGVMPAARSRSTAPARAPQRPLRQLGANPAVALAHLVASMRDDEGRIRSPASTMTSAAQRARSAQPSRPRPAVEAALAEALAGRRHRGRRRPSRRAHDAARR